MELPRTTIEQYEGLKKIGFPINQISKHPTPTIAFVLKWFRDKGFRYEINWKYARMDDVDAEWFHFSIYSKNKDGGHTEIEWHDTYEEAESALIDFLVDALIKQKK